MAEITITETDQRRSTARILDVREDFEVAEGMIPGALHIPMGCKSLPGCSASNWQSDAVALLGRDSPMGLPSN